jgi:glycosyltransferase involved in cell wall biosynthesis
MVLSANTNDLTDADSVGVSMVTVRPGRVGGAESYAKGLLNAYRTLAPCHIRLLANGAVAREYAPLEGGKVSIHHLHGFRTHDNSLGRATSLARATLFPRQLRREAPPDIAAVHYPVVVPLPRLRLPGIITLHDLQHHDMPENFSRTERAYRAIAYDASARHADQIITVSEYSRKRLIENLGVPSERVHAIYHGLDHTRFRPHNADRDRALLDTLDVPSRYIFYPANLWPHKNHRLLVAAFARINDPSVHLVLTGQLYGAGQMLEEDIRHHQALGRIHHLGYVPFDVLPALYRQAIGLVFPSLYEGFGAPPLEAMACGCPVATSDATALAEVCRGASLTFNPKDDISISSALERLVEDQDLRDKLRQDGFKRSALFTWERAAKAHLDVYRLAVQNR